MHRKKPGRVIRKVMEVSPPPFSSPDGQRVLEHLRKLTLERSLGPGASDALLRHLEGQRHLFAYIAALIAQGVGDR